MKSRYWRNICFYKIQIQHLLKLNNTKPIQTALDEYNSNTTLVKVKYETNSISLDKIYKKFKYNTC